MFALYCRGEDRTEDSLLGVRGQKLSDTFVIDIPNETLFQVKNDSLEQYPCRSGGCIWEGTTDRIVVHYHEQLDDGSGGGTAVFDRRLGTLVLDESFHYPSTGLSRHIVNRYTCEKTNMPDAARSLADARKF